MSNVMELMGERYEALYRAFAWYIRQHVAETTGVDALSEETIAMMIEDYVEAHGCEETR